MSRWSLRNVSCSIQLRDPLPVTPALPDLRAQAASMSSSADANSSFPRRL